MGDSPSDHLKAFLQAHALRNEVGVVACLPCKWFIAKDGLADIIELSPQPLTMHDNDPGPPEGWTDPPEML
jgi:hypothetical protein